MLYRPYGNTGKDVSLIGLGTSRFSAAPERFEEFVKLVCDAIEMGVNYFDTAPLYASGVSEKILGEALKQARTKGVCIHAQEGGKGLHIATKSMLSMEPDADAVRRRVDTELAALGIEKITFFHMWSILDLEHYKKVAAPGGPLEGAIRAKEEGLVEHICFSAHCDGQEISQILDDGVFDGVTLGFNAINYRHRIDGLKKATSLGLGTAIMNPLGGGLIPRNPEYFSHMQLHGKSLAGSAAAFVTSHNEVSTILIGAESIDEIIEAEKAVQGSNLSADEWYELLSKASVPKQPLCTTCGYCKGCPKGIDVPQIMNVYNNYILSGFDEKHYFEHREMFLGISKYEQISCAKCGQCERICTQHLPIMERIEDMNLKSRRELSMLKDTIDKYFPESGYPKTGIYGLSLEAKSMLKGMIAIQGGIPGDIEFFDTNPAKWGNDVLGTVRKVQSPSEIKKTKVRRILITAHKYAGEITAYLKDYVEEGTQIETF